MEHININDLIMYDLKKYVDLCCDMNMVNQNSVSLILAYDRLNIAQWIFSTRDYSEKFYKLLLFGACRNGKKDILLYLISLNIYQTFEINTTAFEHAVKYEQFIGKNGLFMDFVYSTLRYINLNDDKLFVKFINEMKMYSFTHYDPMCLPNWFINKKPHRYARIVLQPNVITYTIFLKPERNWKQLLTVLFMSQVKPEPPHKSSIFRSISDDVVKVIGQYLTEYY